MLLYHQNIKHGQPLQSPGNVRKHYNIIILVQPLPVRQQYPQKNIFQKILKKVLTNCKHYVIIMMQGGESLKKSAVKNKIEQHANGKNPEKDGIKK